MAVVDAGAWQCSGLLRIGVRVEWWRWSAVYFLMESFDIAEGA